MPIIGYGAYQTPPNITERRVPDALRIGYRSIDTAQCYGNEREVGLACRKSGMQGLEVGGVWRSAHRPEHRQSSPAFLHTFFKNPLFFV